MRDLPIALTLITMHAFFLGWLYINTRSPLIAVLGHASLSVANNSLSFGKALEFAAAGVPPELEPRTVLLEGAVVDSLAALGPDDVDLLVCGSRGYGPVRRVLLGGVSSRLIRGARLPVAVVPRAASVRRVGAGSVDPVSSTCLSTRVVSHLKMACEVLLAACDTRLASWGG
jgi:hypothetical protein